MSGTKRKVFGAEFKAKVGLEAIHGVNTINQIARCVHDSSLEFPISEQALDDEVS